MINLPITHLADRMLNLTDLLILMILLWTGVIGWRRGGLRSLIDSMSVGSATAVVIFSIPFVKDRLIDGSWALEFRNWIQENVRAVPAGYGFPESNAVADNLYHMVLVGAGALTVWIGIQMILQVFQTVWKIPNGTLLSGVMGTLIGTGMGSVFAWYMVQCLGLLSWLKGFETLDTYLGNSFFVWVILNLAIW